jgi:uncharacterized protein YkwD
MKRILALLVILALASAAGKYYVSVRPTQEELWAFEEINAFRESYGRGEIAWDSRFYRLAKFRAQDMLTRGYFDHVTPEGYCVSHYASEYGIPYSSIAENLYAGGGNASEALLSWRGSRGHRYVLLYPEHERGALACAGEICVFLAAGGDKRWRCMTGDEAALYWETTPLLNDEVL